jgi:RHS repeat-associated protein
MASGLDYFGARYFSAAQGRFTSPDSPSFSKLSYPQTWNLYAYAVNNPLSYIDPTGHEIVCANNAEQCQNDAAAATGNAAAAQRVTTQTTTTQHSFLGLFHWTTSKTTIAISGDINSFRALSQNASRLADLVAGKTTVTVTYDQYARPSMWANGIQLKGGSTSYVPTQGYEAQAFIDPGRYGATYDTDAIAQGIPQSNTAEEFAHEVLGHIWGDVIGLHFALKTGTRANMRDSIQAEDVVRALDPTRGQKALESHHNYQDMPPDPRTGCLPCHQ